MLGFGKLTKHAEMLRVLTKRTEGVYKFQINILKSALKKKKIKTRFKKSRKEAKKERNK